MLKPDDKDEKKVRRANLYKKLVTKYFHKVL